MKETFSQALVWIGFDLIIISLISFAYIFPSMLSASLDRKYTSNVVLINLFLGWTVIGWISVLLFVIFRNDKK